MIDKFHVTQLPGGHSCIVPTKTDQAFASLSTFAEAFNLVDDELMSSTAEEPLPFTPFSINVNLEGEELTSSTGFVPISQGASLAGMPRLLVCPQKTQPVADVEDQAVDNSSMPHLDSPSPDLVPLCSLTSSIAEPVTRKQASSIVRPRPVSDAEVEAALSIGRQARHSQMKRSSIPQKSSISNRAVSPGSCAAPTESSARKQILISPRSVTPLRAVTPPRNLASGSYTSLSPFPSATFGKASRADFRPPQRSSPGRSPSFDAYRRGPEQHRADLRRQALITEQHKVEACISGLSRESSGSKSGLNRRCR